MGRYDSHKHPFQYHMNQWAQKRINDRLERQPKSIPCHVTKVDKDFIEVAFETQNGIFTPPTVKIPQSMSQYGRDPTQVGDKGYAVPGDYYLGGVTGDAGGNTDFYPRGNLTTISFQPVSHKQNPDRDYDQLTHMGGPTGWIVRSFEKQQEDQQQQQQNQDQQQVQAAIGSFATHSFRAQQTKFRKQLGVEVTPAAGGVGGIVGQIIGLVGQISGLSGQQQQQQQQKDKTQFCFDKNMKCQVQSKDEKHNVTVDSQNKTVSMTSSQTIFHDPGDGKVYLGGDGKNGKFCPVMTKCGPSSNVYAKV